MWNRAIMSGVALALGALPAGYAQDKKEEQPKQEEHQHLSPEETIKNLDEIHNLMEKAEELLNGSSHGKAAAEQKELLAQIDKLLGETEKTQKSVMEKIDKLLGKTQGTQKETIDKLSALIKKCKDCAT